MYPTNNVTPVRGMSVPGVTRGMQRGPTLGYIPGLDGLRALAVLAVVVYHANKQWLGGGFLGVEVFFVVSGYLITLLLIAERERSGTVSLGNFWLRRARRLLPALFVLLIGVTVYCAFFDKDRLGMLRGDVIAGALYGANWFQIWTGSSYTSDFAFAPLRHLWSLAVEEQYYIVWPLVMFVLLRRVNKRTLPTLGAWFAGIAAVIAVATAIIYRSGPIDTIVNTPNQYISLFGRDVLRTDFLYLGTISRASGLLLGAALATIWRPWAVQRGRAGTAHGGLDLLGVLALVSLGAMCWRFRDMVTVVDVGDTGYDLLYRGGLFLVGIASVVVIASVTHPRSLLGRWVIGNPVFVWVGKRSYGLYLYHWVIFQAYRKSAGVPLNGREFLGAMLITLGVTELSYRFIETPIRTGTAMEAWRRWRSGTGFGLAPLGAVAVTTIVPVFAFVTMSTARVIPDDITAGLDDNEGAVTSITTTTLANPALTTTTVANGAATTTTLGLAPVARMNVFAIGDSVMLGSAKKLTARGIVVDAAKNRQVKDALQIINYYKSVNKLGDNVIIHLGTNGTTKQATYDSIISPLSGVKNVIVLTVRVPSREYEKLNNRIIKDLPTRYPNVRILDWYAHSKDHREWFGTDGTHPNDAGQDQYVDFIARAVGL